MVQEYITTFKKLIQVREMIMQLVAYQIIHTSKNTTIIDLKAIQQINLTENLERAGNTEMFFIIKEVKKNVLKLSQGTVKIL